MDSKECFIVRSAQYCHVRVNPRQLRLLEADHNHMEAAAATSGLSQLLMAYSQTILSTVTLSCAWP